MKKLLAKLLGLHTDEDLNIVHEAIAHDKKEYYEKVLKQLHHNGTIPPNCDINMPKQNLLLKNAETDEIVAENGKWKRLPGDGELLKVKYKDA